MIIPEHLAWPLEEDPHDPYAGDENLEDPTSGLHDRTFLQAYRDACRGRLALDDPGLRSLAEQMNLVSARSVLGWDLPEGIVVEGISRNPARVLGSAPRILAAPRIPSEQLFADLVENRITDIAMIAPERVLGPWADELPPRGSLLVACGVFAFVPYLSPRVRPVDRYTQDNMERPGAFRESVEAVDHAPPCLWTLRGGIASAEIPLPGLYLPGEEPLRLAPLLDDNPERRMEDGSWLARLLPGPDGRWFASLALRLPEQPDPRRLLLRLRLELWRERRHFPSLTWVDFLRIRSDLLYRFAHELAWVRRFRE